VQAAAEDAGLERLTFHSLRHFHASWLLNQGASDLDVALQLGHGRKDGTVDPTLVRRTYGHPDVESGLARLEAL
jgi:integrase